MPRSAPGEAALARNHWSTTVILVSPATFLPRAPGDHGPRINLNKPCLAREVIEDEIQMEGREDVGRDRDRQGCRTRAVRIDDGSAGKASRDDRTVETERVAPGKASVLVGSELA